MESTATRRSRMLNRMRPTLSRYTFSDFSAMVVAAHERKSRLTIQEACHQKPPTESAASTASPMTVRRPIRRAGPALLRATGCVVRVDGHLHPPPLVPPPLA